MSLSLRQKQLYRALFSVMVSDRYIASDICQFIDDNLESYIDVHPLKYMFVYVSRYGYIETVDDDTYLKKLESLVIDVDDNDTRSVWNATIESLKEGYD